MENSHLEFNLTLDWILNMGTVCPKTGLVFTYKENGNNYGNRAPTTPSVDKIDPSKGYTIDNCQIVCWWYNVAKHQFTNEVVLELCQRVVTTSKIQSAQNVGS